MLKPTMSDRFFKPGKKGEIYHKIDFEGMFQNVKNANIDPIKEIDLICKIAMARFQDNAYHNGIVTYQP